MTSGTSFQQACPRCEAKIRIRDAAFIGKKVPCPKCRHRFVVEKPRAEQAEAAPSRSDQESLRPESSAGDGLAWPGTGPALPMPAAPEEDELSELEVAAPFYLGVYAVTQEEYRKIMGSSPSSFSGSGDRSSKVGGMNTGKHPVENVSWLDAVAFCNKLSSKEGRKPYYDADGKVRGGDGYRLPTEAEWEFACRAGTQTAYSFGDDEELLGEHGWYDDNSGGRTQPVGTKKANAFGLYDMHGNVWKWCEDLYEGGPARVIRGGSWDFLASSCRSALRIMLTPAYRYINLGFRVARVPSSVVQ